VRVEISFDGVFGVLSFFNTAFPKGSGVTGTFSLGLGSSHGGLKVDLKLVLGRIGVIRTMAVLVVVVKESMSVEQNFVKNQNEGISGEDQDFGQREDFPVIFQSLCISINLIPTFDLFRGHMNESDGDKDAGSEGICNAHDLGVFTATGHPCWDHSRDERLGKGNEYEDDLDDEDSGVIITVIFW